MKALGYIPPVPRDLLPAALLMLLLGAAPGCQGAIAPGEGSGDGPEASARTATGSPDGDQGESEPTLPGTPAPRPVPLTAPPEPGADTRAEVVPGPYADDRRFAVLAATWPARVAQARERLPVVTGLTFMAGPPPRVILTALRDETRPFELAADVVDGRKRVSVRVNAEPHLGGLLDVDRTLLRALGTAALEDALARRDGAPAWVLEVAGMAAANDLEERLAGIQRLWALGRIDAIRVDPDDPRAALATGTAALLLVGERGAPSDIHRLLSFVADGDDADMVMGRIAGEAGGGWVEPARLVLHQRVRDLDERPWRLLEAAEAAYAEAGRAALEALLPARLPPAVADELTLLRARAALDVGEVELGRSLLRSLPADAAARLREPAEALALGVEAELARGGDRVRARDLLRRLRLDFPRSPAGERLARSEPTLGLQDDPLRWMREVRERVAREGGTSLELDTAERYARVLVLDHRAGAAEGFLASLGRRAAAPELQAVARAVASEQEDPSLAAKARAADRLRAWRAEPTPERRQDLVDGGLATAAMIVDMVMRQPDVRGEPRQQMLVLAAEAAGDERALRVLEPIWQADPLRLLDDLPLLTSAVSFDALDAALREDGLVGRLGLGSEVVWDVVAGGLEQSWLRARPGFLAAIRSPSYDDRRRALESLLEDPDLRVPRRWLVELMRDPAPRLRQRAVEQAATQGDVDLVREALADERPSVRSAAVRGLASIGGPAARDDLLAHLGRETDGEVRSVTAFALLEVAPTDGRVLASLLALVREDDTALRDPLVLALGNAPRGPVAYAVADALEAENARPAPDRAYLFRLMTVWQRATRFDLGWHPAMTREQTALVLARMRRALQEQRLADGDS
ncbi:MAG: HEAT repeat domain-containing protein [Planctomycetes bacterium]|nr:HEAT repeat domain-containing protein [Planctomycetota bacterium]MCB9830685.1 HEAT repeat domain-containing protein [Planctomycetota bacterium]